MTDLYPLKFEPILKERIWGGNRISEIFQKGSQANGTIGESWEISSLNENISIISNGFLAGNNLEELAEVYMGDLVGDTNFEKYGIQFPILLKIIDAQDDLSIQVHPGDKLAIEEHGEPGKTEMWYVLDADPDSSIYCGLKDGATIEQLMEGAKKGDPCDFLNRFNVRKGDFVFIPAGTVHSIGKGVMVAEVQQPSDITYRIFDWNRSDSKGNNRELHLSQAVKAIDIDIKTSGPVPSPEILNQTVNLVNCEYFVTNIIHFDKKVIKDYNLTDSFVIYFVIDGEMIIKWPDGVETAKSGESVLIPAMMGDITLEPRGECSLLEVFINNPIV